MEDKYKQLRIGLAGLGLKAYWAQFEGLEDRLLGYLGDVENKVSAEARAVINLGLVDTPEKGLAAGHACRQHDVDLLLIYVTTYALSSTVLPLILRAKVPVILLNLQPTMAINYQALNKMTSRTAMTGEWLAYCSACPLPEIANVLRRLDIPFHQITGTLHGDLHVWTEIEGWLRAAGVAHALAHSRMGLMGHYYGGMLDIATDLVQISGRFGVHIEMLEIDELSALRRNADEDSIDRKLAEFQAFFAIDEDCSPTELAQAARTSIALDQLIADKNLNMLAYYYKGSGVQENEDSMNSIILGTSMLTGAGVPVAGEYEVKNVIAMKIMDLLGAGGSFSEYYAIDFNADAVLMGHDGPGHAQIAQSRIKVRPLQVYHGKVGKGLSVEMSIKYGPVTLLSVVEHKVSGFMLLAAQGSSVPGEILEIGNTNSHYTFPIGARRFVEEWNAHGPAHHCAIGIGHIANQIEKLAKLLGLNFAKVC